MSKLYIFGIGGTGSRVIKSLTMLLASGVKMNTDSIVPIIIDPDTAAADLTRTIQLIRNYNNIRSCLGFNTSVENRFFNTEIEEIVPDYRMAFQNTQNKKFKDFIGIDTMRDENGNFNSNHAFAKMLFSDDNLEDDMQVGFKGNPNIGSVVLNQFVSTKEFNDFSSSFKQGDKIFIISSIFGGTGASGFPLLLKNIRGIDPALPAAGLIQKAPIGAITLLPYFDVKPNPESRIDSSTFISKTRAALSYYENNISGNNSVNTLYYIGDNIVEQYENAEGGPKQQNNAHFIELAAALSIVDFVSIPENNLTGSTIFKEFGIKNNTQTITLNDLEQISQDTINKPLTQFVLFCKYLNEQLNSSKNQNWAVNHKFDDQFFSTPFFDSDLRSFCSSYLEWLREMKDNKRSFEPFELEERKTDVFSLIKGKPPVSVRNFKYFNKSNYSFFDAVLNNKESGVSKSYRSEHRFIDLFYSATNNIVELKFRF